MSSAPRKIFLTVLVIAILAAAALYYLTSNLNGIVAGIIESQGSAATQTAVGVSGVDIRLSDASAALSGLSIANPDGFNGNAMELRGFSIKLDPGSLTKEVIVVNDVTVDGARINLLQQGTRNNLKELMANLQGGGPEDSTPQESGGKKIIIEKFTLSGASASVTAPGLDGTQEVELTSIIVRDIGRSTNGATAAQVAQQILKPVMEKALSSAAAGAMKEKANEKIGEAVGDLLKGFGKK